MTEKPQLSVAEARRLHDGAAAMSVPELRRFGKLYFGREWLSSARKKSIVNGFRKSLEDVIDAAGATP